MRRIINRYPCQQKVDKRAAVDCFWKPSSLSTYVCSIPVIRRVRTADTLRPQAVVESPPCFFYFSARAARVIGKPASFARRSLITTDLNPFSPTTPRVQTAAQFSLMTSLIRPRSSPLTHKRLFHDLSFYHQISFWRVQTMLFFGLHLLVVASFCTTDGGCPGDNPTSYWHSSVFTLAGCCVLADVYEILFVTWRKMFLQCHFLTVLTTLGRAFLNVLLLGWLMGNYPGDIFVNSARCGGRRLCDVSLEFVPVRHDLNGHNVKRFCGRSRRETDIQFRV